MKKTTMRATASKRRATALPALGWTLLTNHAHVLLCISREPTARLRDIATRVEITERMVQKIVAELIEGGYLSVRKVGRRNHYAIGRRLKLPHPLVNHRSVGELLDLID